MSRGLLRALGALSLLELASIAILLVNLATVHWRPITAAMGPLHGAAYLSVAMVAVFGRGLLLRTRLMALIPVAGGILTPWNIRREGRRLGPDSATAER